MRRPIIAGNWKMHKTVGEALQLAQDLNKILNNTQQAEVVLCPPFTALSALSAAIKPFGYKLGAQDVFWEKQGAFTGEVSPAMLADVGCDYVIIGHSERRQYFGETDETVNKKIKAVLAEAMTPIVCVGESLSQREAGETEKLVEGQVRGAFAQIPAEQVAGLVIAYEPIWAIGTGRTASSDDANAVCALIRRTIAELYDKDVADKLRIQYGGSVKPDNIAELMGKSDIDGALVGGASLEAATFAKIAKY